MIELNFISKRIKSYFGRFRVYFNRRVSFSGVGLFLPAGHKLDIYKDIYRNYDRKLPLIAGIIEGKYPEMIVVDIGANIGDTAVFLMEGCGCKVVCVEGNPAFLPYLNMNLKSYGSRVLLVEGYLGVASGGFRVVTNNGTARLEMQREGQGQSFISYQEVCQLKHEMGCTKLIKIDTDGFDFNIIKNSADSFSQEEAVLFFEYDTGFKKEGDKEALEAIGSLVKVGYKYFVVYDNFGNFLTSVSADWQRVFADFNVYLRQSRRGGGVSYFDVCCFKECDFDLYLKVLNFEASDDA